MSGYSAMPPLDEPMYVSLAHLSAARPRGGLDFESCGFAAPTCVATMDFAVMSTAPPSPVIGVSDAQALGWAGMDRLGSSSGDVCRGSSQAALHMKRRTALVLSAHGTDRSHGVQRRRRRCACILFIGVGVHSSIRTSGSMSCVRRST